MVCIKFRLADGTEQAVEANIGDTLMATAKAHGVAGIEAECGGSMVCGTCHVYAEGEGYAVVGAPSEMEAEMLDYALSPEPTSRLSCQIVVSAQMDGLEFRVPERQR